MQSLGQSLLCKTVDEPEIGKLSSKLSAISMEVKLDRF